MANQEQFKNSERPFLESEISSHVVASLLPFYTMPPSGKQANCITLTTFADLPSAAVYRLIQQGCRKLDI